MRNKKRTLKFSCTACEEGFAKIRELIKDISEIKAILSSIQNVKNAAENPAFEMEEAERERRAKKFLILNVTESPTGNRADKNGEEINTVKGILTNLENFKLMRIGKYTVGKTRSLKVVYEKREDAVNILKN